MLNKVLKQERGFTLIEMILVIAILSTLLLFAVPAIKDVLDASKEAEKQSHVKTVNAASKQYEAEYGETVKDYKELADAQMAFFKEKQYKYAVDDEGVISVEDRTGEDDATE